MMKMIVAPVQRTAYTRAEAAASMGMSLDSFERHVQPGLKLVRCGSLRIIPVEELRRWLKDHAETVFDEACG